jgi:hypothetical protein
MDTITVSGWQGWLGKGLAPRELEAVLYAAQDKTIKQIARDMGIAPDSVSKRLTDARFHLGYQRSIRGAVLEAWKRGIIAPLALALMFCVADNDRVRIRRPVHSVAQLRMIRENSEASAFS